MLFFLTHSLIERCQIVTDTCKNNVSKFVWKPFKSPLSLRKWKCFGEASLFNLHHLYFINTIYLLKNCSVYGRSYCIYSPKSFRFFRKEFHYVRKINKYINYPLRVGLWPRAVFLRPRSQFFTIRSSVDIYLFQVTKNCDPWGTDHIQGQICKHVFAQNRGCCVHYPTNILQCM